MAEKQKLCVTGAGGYVASWLVKLLLSKGHTIHGTVRNPGDAKYAHLHNLDKAADNLKLFKADLLDYDSLAAAITGCIGVFHVASPVPPSSVPNPQKDLVEPALNGTLNVLKACSEANVKRVVIVSSVAAVCVIPNWPKDKVKDETCWSDQEYCIKTNNWYCYSKTVAEKEAFEYAKKSGLQVITICPSIVWGPILQQTLNTSSLVLVKLLSKEKTVMVKLLKEEGDETVENRGWPVVDVRDVAESLVLLYERAEAEGRYICTAHEIKSQDLVEMLKKMYPNYNYPKSFTAREGDDEKLSSERLQRLGWTYRPLEETLKDSVESYRQAGILDLD